MPEIDIYTPRVLTGSFSQIKPVNTWLKDTFFPDQRPRDAKVLEIEVYKEAASYMAEFVHPRLEAAKLRRPGYETKFFKPAYVKEDIPMTVDDLLDKPMGATVYDPVNRGKRRKELLAEDLGDLRNRFDRRLEWMAAMVMVTGQCPIVGRGVNRIIDFGMAGTHLITLTGSAMWNAVDTADPLQNLIDWSGLIQGDCGLIPNYAIFGNTAWKYFKQNKTTQLFLDNRRMEMGELRPRRISDYLFYLGEESETGLSFYRYTGRYYDKVAQQEKFFIPEDRVLIASSGAKTGTFYGAIQDLKAGGPLKYFVKSWEEENPSVVVLLAQSSPIVAMQQADGFVSVKVL